MRARKLFGQNLRRLRLAAGLSQREFGERIDADQSRIAELEGGRWATTLDLVERVADALNCPIAELFADADPNTEVSSAASRNLNDSRQKRAKQPKRKL